MKKLYLLESGQTLDDHLPMSTTYEKPLVVWARGSMKKSN